MDVNNTRFHLFLGHSDWERCKDSSGSHIFNSHLNSPVRIPEFAWKESVQSLTLQPEIFIYTQKKAAQQPLHLERNRRGCDVDKYGNIYWIAENKYEIYVQSAGDSVSTQFWSSYHLGNQQKNNTSEFVEVEPQPVLSACQLSGLCVTSHHYLVVGVEQTAGVLIFDLYSNGSPLFLQWPVALEFNPYDLSAGSDGEVFILDRLHHRVWVLDKYFNLISKTESVEENTINSDFEEAYPVTGVAETDKNISSEISLEASLLLEEDEPVAIVALDNARFLILFQPLASPLLNFSFASVSVYHFCHGTRNEFSTNIIEKYLPENLKYSLQCYDFAAVDMNHEGMNKKKLNVRVDIAAVEGNQCFAFLLQECEDGSYKFDAIPEYLPMRLFGGKGLIANKESVYYDFESGWIPLKQQTKPRYQEQAILYTDLLDGHKLQCVWHRLILDAVIPPDCNVQIWSRAADEQFDEDELTYPQWKKEPRLYRRNSGSEIPYRATSQRAHDGSWELLFQSLKGRYAQLKIVISSDQRSTPELHALRIYYQRFSYLSNYLPAVYSEDEISASFVERFLANMEGTFTNIEDRIAAVQILFDPECAPEESLPWLAEWLGVVFDGSWQEKRRRLFLKHALTFFQWRGTSTGIKMALRLALDTCIDDTLFTLEGNRDEKRYGIRIIENYRKRKLAGKWSPKDGFNALNDSYRQYFSITDDIAVFPVVSLSMPDNTLWQQFSEQYLGFIPHSDEEMFRWHSFLCHRYGYVENLPLAYGSVNSFEAIAMPSDLPTESVKILDWEIFQKIGNQNHQSIIFQWHNFLAGRYASIGELNFRYGTQWRRFSEISYPEELPNTPEFLSDWFDFESKVLGMKHSAHRFQVMIPLSPDQVTEQQREKKRDLAHRIVELEKPAHTVFDVQFYWAMFLVGNVRLGYDTLLDEGSRAPKLASNAILNKMYLGSSYINSRIPAGQRLVAGIGELNQGSNKGRCLS